MSDAMTGGLEQLKARVDELEGLLARAQMPCSCGGVRRPISPALRTVRILHRWAALIASVFLLVMAVSGIFLTHAYHLGLQPLMVQLHTGLFLGPAARVYCDVLGLSLAVLAASGIYMNVASLRQARARAAS